MAGIFVLQARFPFNDTQDGYLYQEGISNAAIRTKAWEIEHNYSYGRAEANRKIDALGGARDAYLKLIESRILEVARMHDSSANLDLSPRYFLPEKHSEILGPDIEGGFQIWYACVFA